MGGSRRSPFARRGGLPRAREIPLGAYLSDHPEPGMLPEPPGDTTAPADQAAAREQCT